LILFYDKQEGSGFGSPGLPDHKKHDGHVTVESFERGGDDLPYLPACLAGEPAAHAADAGIIARGGGTVLVMDDEEFVREVSGEMLRDLGYSVAFAKNGAEAIALYRAALEANRPFDMVIMDLTVPGGMGGKEAVQQLRALDPKVKAIVSSGSRTIRSWRTTRPTASRRHRQAL
jgi:CheY-like chemotaxis protein